MKRALLYILLLVFTLSSTNITAQHKEYKGKINITPLQLQQIGDSLYISINFDIEGVNVDLRRSISLIPVLATYNKEIALSEVMVKGRANYLTSKRELALMNNSERRTYEQNIPYAVVKGYRSDSPKRVEYKKTILFEPWMKDARLDIREDLCGCGNLPRSIAMSQLINQVQLERIVMPYIITPHIAYVKPEAEAVKKREMVGEAFLDFVVAKTDIRPDYMNNPSELKKVTDMMEEVRNDQAITVKGVYVIGYASPEGTLKLNQKLSEGRANALVNYLLPKFNYPKETYHIEFGGENWAGLIKTVNESDIEDKKQVLDVLTNKEITDEQRKNKLKLLKSGEPYRYMLKEYYPSLRKAICKIDYEVKGFSVDEAKLVFKTRPQNLSLNEMYVIANTYTAGSQEFIDVYETAVRMFSGDVVASLNAASAALSRKDLVSAERYLDKINGKISTAEYHNTLGVLYMLKEDYTKAKSELTIAINKGFQMAELNLAELTTKLENIELIKSKTK